MKTKWIVVVLAISPAGTAHAQAQVVPKDETLKGAGAEDVEGWNPALSGTAKQKEPTAAEKELADAKARAEAAEKAMIEADAKIRDFEQKLGACTGPCPPAPDPAPAPDLAPDPAPALAPDPASAPAPTPTP